MNESETLSNMAQLIEIGKLPTFICFNTSECFISKKQLVDGMGQHPDVALFFAALGMLATILVYATVYCTCVLHKPCRSRGRYDIENQSPDIENQISRIERRQLRDQITQTAEPSTNDMEERSVNQIENKAGKNIILVKAQIINSGRSVRRLQRSKSLTFSKKQPKTSCISNIYNRTTSCSSLPILNKGHQKHSNEYVLSRPVTYVSWKSHFQQYIDVEEQVVNELDNKDVKKLSLIDTQILSSEKSVCRLQRSKSLTFPKEQLETSCISNIYNRTTSISLPILNTEHQKHTNECVMDLVSSKSHFQKSNDMEERIVNKSDNKVVKKVRFDYTQILSSGRNVCRLQRSKSLTLPKKQLETSWISSIYYCTTSISLPILNTEHQKHTNEYVLDLPLSLVSSESNFQKSNDMEERVVNKSDNKDVKTVSLINTQILSSGKSVCRLQRSKSLTLPKKHLETSWISSIYYCTTSISLPILNTEHQKHTNEYVLDLPLSLVSSESNFQKSNDMEERVVNKSDNKDVKTVSLINTQILSSGKSVCRLPRSKSLTFPKEQLETSWISSIYNRTTSISLPILNEGYRKASNEYVLDYPLSSVSSKSHTITGRAPSILLEPTDEENYAKISRMKSSINAAKSSSTLPSSTEEDQLSFFSEMSGVSSEFTEDLRLSCSLSVPETKHENVEEMKKFISRMSESLSPAKKSDSSNRMLKRTPHIRRWRQVHNQLSSLEKPCHIPLSHNVDKQISASSSDFKEIEIDSKTKFKREFYKTSGLDSSKIISLSSVDSSVFSGNEIQDKPEILSHNMNQPFKPSPFKTTERTTIKTSTCKRQLYRMNAFYGSESSSISSLNGLACGKNTTDDNCGLFPDNTEGLLLSPSFDRPTTSSKTNSKRAFNAINNAGGAKKKYISTPGGKIFGRNKIRSVDNYENENKTGYCFDDLIYDRFNKVQFETFSKTCRRPNRMNPANKAPIYPKRYEYDCSSSDEIPKCLRPSRNTQINSSFTKYSPISFYSGEEIDTAHTESSAVNITQTAKPNYHEENNEISNEVSTQTYQNGNTDRGSVRKKVNAILRKMSKPFKTNGAEKRN